MSNRRWLYEEALFGRNGDLVDRQREAAAPGLTAAQKAAADEKVRETERGIAWWETQSTITSSYTNWRAMSDLSEQP